MSTDEPTPQSGLYDASSGYVDVNTNAGDDQYTPSRARPPSRFERLVATAIPPGGVASSAFNLCCSTLGASIIGIPGGMKACGVVLGSVLLVLFSACTIYSIRLLCLASERSGLPSYEAMARQLLGRFLDRVCTFTMVVFCWGSGVSYIAATADLIDPLLDGHVPAFWTSTWGVRLITTLFWAVTMLPLALMREINSLRYVSTFGVIAILYFVGVMVGHSAGSGMAEGNLHRISLISGGADVLVGVGLVMFTFCCQPNVLEVYSELQTQTVHQMTKIGGVAMGCCTCLYFLAGFFAYVDFGADVKGSVLKNYHLGDNVPLYIAYTCLAVKLTAGHTLCIAPTRDSVLYTLKLGEYHTADPTKRMIISALLSASALLVALFIPSLQLLFGFLGGLCGSLLGFVFPALFAIRAPGWAENSTKWDRIGAWALVVIGAIVFVLGTVASIYESVA